ncbi:MAG: hypothetical protein LBE82_02275 [Chitinophagaceae bacterium]|jgi:hypothetical protein|nr:hypothetical protein [Chitinophagaceae bacterium]
MKKFVVILVLFSYTVSVTGLTVSRFYCCGKLKSTEIVFESNHKKGCTSKQDGRKCCKYNDSFFKVSDNHFGSTAHFVVDAPVAGLAYFDTCSFLEKNFSALVLHRSNAPPPKSLQPQYLLNCNFRI